MFVLRLGDRTRNREDVCEERFYRLSFLLQQVSEEPVEPEAVSEKDQVDEEVREDVR